MPFAANDEACLTKLGRQLKHLRNPGEQFCVFAFDLMEHDALAPSPGDIDRDQLPFDGEASPPIWNAAFYADVAPSHTERALLNVFGQWISDYEGTFEHPNSLYIYSFLIPCLRDGDHGNCADNIFEFIIWAKRHFGLKKVRIAWSNDDRDHDIAYAIKVLLADLDDEGIDVSIYRVSITG